MPKANSYFKKKVLKYKANLVCDLTKEYIHPYSSKLKDTKHLIAI